MQLPVIGRPEYLNRMSSSTYDSARKCKARVAFAHDKTLKEAMPSNPYALLGRAYHKVLEEINSHNLFSNVEDPLAAVGQRFDTVVTEMYATAHWLLKAKYPSVIRLPRYNLQRARLLEHCRTFIKPRVSASHRVVHSSRFLVEQEFYSKDGLLYGRVDLIDVERKEVIDYKTGNPPAENTAAIKDQELDQLRFYAYLASENGIEIKHGVIVRSNGQAINVEMNIEQVQLEARMAKATLRDYNEAVERDITVEQLAQPSPEHCHDCPFIAFCEAFWQQATPAWASTVGVHVQGLLTSVTQTQGAPHLVTLALQPSGGTHTYGSELVTTLVPKNCISENGIELPKPSNLIRVVDTWIVGTRTNIGQIKISTASTIWTKHGS